MTNIKSSVDFDHINDTVQIAMKAAEKFQFKVAQGHLQVLLTSFPGLKAILRIYNNSLTSISEGLKDDILTRAAALREVQKANKEFEQGVAKNTDALSAPPKYDPEVLYQDLSHESLKVFDKNMNQVQTELNKRGIFTGYCPVLPITQPPLDVTKLKAIGLPADTFAGYSILKKQFVAGITVEELHKMMSMPHDVSMSEAKKKELEEEAIGHFKEIILAKYKNLKLVQMGGTHGWWSAYWFWFAPASEFRALKACTINSTTVQSLSIKNWSFPFKR